MSRRLLIVCCCLIVLTACGSGSKDPALTIQGRWWTWAATAPSGSNPVEDETGEFCDRDQPADVWFLAGTFGGEVDRQCTIPQGRPIEVPIINMYSSAPQDCAEFMLEAEGNATLDGKELPLDRIDSESIVVTARVGW